MARAREASCPSVCCLQGHQAKRLFVNASELCWQCAVPDRRRGVFCCVLSQVAESGAVKKLNVEGGVAAKARAVYAGLFVPAAPADSNGSSSPQSPGSPKANGSSDAAANGSSGSSKLTPAVVAAVPLLKQLASDPPGQLAQLVAMEWLLAVSSSIGASSLCRS